VCLTHYKRGCPSPPLSCLLVLALSSCPFPLSLHVLMAASTPLLSAFLCLYYPLNSPPHTLNKLTLSLSLSLSIHPSSHTYIYAHTHMYVCMYVCMYLGEGRLSAFIVYSAEESQVNPVSFWKFLQLFFSYLPSCLRAPLKDEMCCCCCFVSF
jgi:hypothetical protein